MTSAFVPSPNQLIPNLSGAQELVLLARTLWHEGYDDHLAGHITIKQPDGTFLCNPWFITWDELRPEQIIRIDIEGRVVEGDWPAPLGIPLHLELHKMRHDVNVALHNHPRFGTIWADTARIPQCYDQSSSLGGGTIALVDEYSAAVDSADAARAAVEAMGNADMALLANHGVFVTGSSVRAVHQRSVALEQRCRHAWYVEALGGGQPMPESVMAQRVKSDGTKFIGFWEAMVRAELRRDPTLLD